MTTEEKRADPDEGTDHLRDDLDDIMSIVETPRETQAWENKDFESDNAFFTHDGADLKSPALHARLSGDQLSILFDKMLGKGWHDVPGEQVRALMKRERKYKRKHGKISPKAFRQMMGTLTHVRSDIRKLAESKKAQPLQELSLIHI